MQKRMTYAYCVLLLLMTVLIFRIYQINKSAYTAVSRSQGLYKLSVAQSRGVIYDRNMQPLVNESSRFVGSVMPTPQTMEALIPRSSDEMREILLERFHEGLPFITELPDQGFYTTGIDIFRVPRRYSEKQLAPHIIGYLGANGLDGAAGIERAFNDALIKAGSTIETRYKLDAIGHLMSGDSVTVQRSGDDIPRAGVVLTLDKYMQSVTQAALAAGCERGAAVVLDIHTGDIIAMSSLPAFDQLNLAEALNRSDAPFINRATSGFSIGSVFKVLISAAALESGYTENHRYSCNGYIDISGQIFRCNNHTIHGDIDMGRALQVSCNTYFIDLGMKLDPRLALALMSNLGLGRVTELAPGIETNAGNLPDISEFINPAAIANFSFGQGSSLATPLQMACAIASVANGGVSVTPRLVLGQSSDGFTLTNPERSYSQNRVLSEKTAKTLAALMIDVVEKGSGRTAKPIRGGAGGKTSSAQTGRITDGVEEVHAWFVGFYPADKPKYSIAVFVEGGVSGENIAGPIFKQIANGIGML